jgi:sugar phosphate isomerase/epimerase
MGISIYALGIHQRNAWAGRHQGLSPALALLEESRLLGAGGIQVELGSQDASKAEEMRRRSERHGMFIEAIIGTPRDDADVARFERDIRLAQDAGAVLARTVILPGRRYEQFKSMAEFRDFERRGLESLQRAAPVLARHRFRLAVENHKDQRIAEKLETLRRVGSEWIGLCVDFGNNFPLMEDALSSVRAFAPLAFTAHIKDQAVRAYDEGYLLADVPLGAGFLELREMVQALRDARPDIRFNYETITRDPIRVPILTEGYWATLPDTPARELARTWTLARAGGPAEAFGEVSRLSRDEQLALERRGIEQSIAFGRDQLGL